MSRPDPKYSHWHDNAVTGGRGDLSIISSLSSPPNPSFKSYMGETLGVLRILNQNTKWELSLILNKHNFRASILNRPTQNKLVNKLET